MQKSSVKFTDRNGNPVIGIHSNRGKYMIDEKRTRSRRIGSGKRRHLGDNITNVGTGVNELSDRERALKR